MRDSGVRGLSLVACPSLLVCLSLVARPSLLVPCLLVARLLVACLLVACLLVARLLVARLLVARLLVSFSRAKLLKNKDWRKYRLSDFFIQRPPHPISFLIFHFSFFILHFSFFIFHSSFFILHFSFFIFHSLNHPVQRLAILPDVHQPAVAAEERRLAHALAVARVEGHRVRVRRHGHVQHVAGALHD